MAAMQPDYGDAYYEMGALYAKAGQLEEARAALRRALEVEPGHAKAARLLERLEGR